MTYLAPNQFAKCRLSSLVGATHAAPSVNATRSKLRPLYR